MGEFSIFHWLVVGGLVWFWWMIFRSIRAFFAGYRGKGSK